jgi:NACalpha-BTF3-like transcription factor
MKLRDYQIKLSTQASEILEHKKIVYLAMEVRTGKTLTALNIAKLYEAKNVLFLTKKKAISSIQWDYDNFGFDFDLTIINDESLHLVNEEFDLIIHDEHHRFGAFPKPNKVAVLFKKRYSHLPMIFLSGTPTPESHSQWFNQFWVSDHSPFKKYVNFYKWAVDYVDIKQRNIGYAVIKDYSTANEGLIKRVLQNYIITFTQAQAGFTTSVKEMVLECEMLPITKIIIEKLKKDLVVKNPEGQVILGDTGVKLMQKIHQLSSGTCKFEDGSSKVIDYSKALFILEKFTGVKIAIFYKFKEEWNALKSVYGDNLTDSVEEFDNTDKYIALQIVSGREGISLKNAKYLVYYNIDFSATSYWQSRDRLTTMQRQSNEVFWIFSKGGIENDIYKTVLKKKDYTLKIFKENGK